MQEEEGKTSAGDQRGTGGLGREEEGGLGKRALSKGTVKKKKKAQWHWLGEEGSMCLESRQMTGGEASAGEGSLGPAGQ